MGQRIVYAALAALISTAAYAEHAIDVQYAVDGQHAVAVEPQRASDVSDPSDQPAGVRQVCSTTDFGYGEIRTDCRTEAIVPAKADPALKGICTIYYGRRTCY